LCGDTLALRIATGNELAYYSIEFHCGQTGQAVEPGDVPHSNQSPEYKTRARKDSWLLSSNVARAGY
jgi:hypothetical protein